MASSSSPSAIPSSSGSQRPHARSSELPSVGRAKSPPNNISDLHRKRRRLSEPGAAGGTSSSSAGLYAQPPGAAGVTSSSAGEAQPPGAPDGTSSAGYGPSSPSEQQEQVLPSRSALVRCANGDIGALNGVSACVVPERLLAKLGDFLAQLVVGKENSDLEQMLGREGELRVESWIQNWDRRWEQEEVVDRVGRAQVEVDPEAMQFLKRWSGDEPLSAGNDSYPRAEDLKVRYTTDRWQLWFGVKCGHFDIL